MKLNAEQLPQKLKTSLAPIYIISGDETLLRNEVCDLIHQTAQTAGYGRETHIVDKKFDWQQWWQQSLTLNLFQAKSVLDLHCQNQSLTRQAHEVLARYAKQPPKDKILILRLAKLDKKQQAAKWFKAISEHSVFVPIWPINLSQFPQWLRARLQQHKVTTSADAFQLLVTRLEGNLLAAQQAVEKLQLLYPQKQSLSLAEVQPVLADSANYSVFDFADCALRGEAQRLGNILHHLQHSGTEATLALWALSKELRLLTQCRAALDRGEQLGQLKTFSFLWQARKTLIQFALKRYSGNQWQRLLRLATRVDMMIKGGEQGDPWIALHRLALAIAGVDITR